MVKKTTKKVSIWPHFLFHAKIFYIGKDLHITYTSYKEHLQQPKQWLPKTIPLKNLKIIPIDNSHH